MKVLTKRQAHSEVLNSLFRPGGTLACLPKERFDMGKYRETVIGRDVPEHAANGVHLVWAERRKDSDGPYFALFCISKREQA